MTDSPSFFKVANWSLMLSGKQILHGLHLELNQGDTLAILGKSGSGKTSLLKSLSGEIDAKSGSIQIEGVSSSVAQKQILYLSQEPMLFPHLTVEANLGFALRIRGKTKSEQSEAAQEMAHILGVSHVLQSFPNALSGGEKQRVNFGRALLAKPSILLLDEPFGNLDSVTRKKMQEFYKSLSSRLNITSIVVTHDVKEALVLGNQWGIMDEGALDLFSTVSELHRDTRSGMKEEYQFWMSHNI